jgi:uncharacterized protein YndB with AHSA1/START domain
VTARDPGPLLPATLSPASDDRWALVLERAFDHPPAEVWAALVDPDRQVEWAPFRSDRDLTTPGPATLTMLDGEEEMTLPGDVIEATDGRSASIRWSCSSPGHRAGPWSARMRRRGAGRSCATATRMRSGSTTGSDESEA